MDSLRNTEETVLTLQSLTRRREMRLMTPLKENYYCQYILCSHVNVSLLIFMKLVRRIWASLNVEVSNKIRKGKQMQKEILSDRRDHWTTTLVYGEEQQFIEWIVFVEYLSIYQWRDILFLKEKKAIRLYYQLWLLTNRSIQSHVTSFSINFHSRSW